MDQIHRRGFLKLMAPLGTGLSSTAADSAQPSSLADEASAIDVSRTAAFVGRYAAGIDLLGRMTLPPRYQDILGHHYGRRLILVANEEAIEVHPLEEWRRLRAIDCERGAATRLDRLRANEVELDHAGRILLVAVRKQS